MTPESDQGIPPDDVLPCGCVFRCSIVNGVKTGTYIPCRETCVNYRNMLGLAAQANKPVERRMAK